jgi:hypothetical protein
MAIATKMLISLIVLGLIDVLIPIPIIGIILIYVILQRPAWFRRIVETIYHVP